MVGIYKIESPSGKVYVGQSWNIRHRWFVYKGSGAKNQPKLNASFNKHGARNHSYAVLTDLPEDVTQDILDEYEKLYIRCFKESGFHLLNLQEGGRGGKHSEETKKRISEQQKGYKKPNSGSFKKGHTLIRTEEHRKNISKALNGKKISEKTKEKLRQHNLGKKQSRDTVLKREMARRETKFKRSCQLPFPAWVG